MSKTILSDTPVHGYDPIDIVWADTALPETGTALRGQSVVSTTLTAPDAALATQFIFRPWQAKDADFYAQMLAEPALWRFMYETRPDPMTPDLARHLISFSREAAHHKVRAVEWNGQVIGQVRLQWDTRTTPPQQAELSYWLARGHWGKRLAAPMIALECWRAFSLFPALQCIMAFVHRDNIASHRALQRVGFAPAPPHLERPDWQGYRLLRAQGLDWAKLPAPR